MKVQQLIAKAKAAHQSAGRPVLKVGFIKSARYPQWRGGDAVTDVAAKNEFGLRINGKMAIPERPFFRQGNRAARPDLEKTLRQHINTKTMAVTDRVMGLVGEVWINHIKASITNLRKPPNAPYTIKKKKSSNPLIHEGFMKRSVDYEIKR